VATLGHGVARRSCLTRRQGESGQSLTETIIALTIVLAIFFGLVHLSLLAVTRHVCNYAAFAGARAALYAGQGDQQQGLWPQNGIRGGSHSHARQFAKG
jgi:hypothetical protein